MKKKITIVVDILMFAILLAQMLYVFAGNVVHEILGIAFFVCLITHMILKRHWLKSLINSKGKKLPASVWLFHIVTILLVISVIALMLSSIDVSRFIFPDIHFLGSLDFHRYLATAVLALAILHGGLHLRLRSKHKKRFTIILVILTIAGIATGLFLLPYLNRHFKTVEVKTESVGPAKKVSTLSDKPLVVYFTRLGNTDFEEDVDAVSGASLLKLDGRLMGSNELIASMVKDAIDCDVTAVTLIGEKYPSSYNDTVTKASEELNEQARPEIKPIDISNYNKIILIYPIWWGTVPMPVATFLESGDFSGKTIYLIATQGSIGFASSTADVEKMCPGAQVNEGISIYCEDIPDARKQVEDYLKTIK